MIHYLW